MPGPIRLAWDPCQLLGSGQGKHLQAHGILVLLFFEHPVPEELGRAEGFFDMLVRTAVQGNPRQGHDAICNRAELGIHWIRPVCILQLRNGRHDIVDGLQYAHQSRRIGLGSLCCEQQEPSLL